MLMFCGRSCERRLVPARKASGRPVGCRYEHCYIAVHSIVEIRFCDGRLSSRRVPHRKSYKEGFKKKLASKLLPNCKAVKNLNGRKYLAAQK